METPGGRQEHGASGQAERAVQDIRWKHEDFSTFDGTGNNLYSFIENLRTLPKVKSVRLVQNHFLTLQAYDSEAFN